MSRRRAVDSETPIILPSSKSVRRFALAHTNLASSCGKSCSHGTASSIRSISSGEGRIRLFSVRSLSAASVAYLSHGSRIHSGQCVLWPIGPRTGGKRRSVRAASFILTAISAPVMSSLIGASAVRPYRAPLAFLVALHLPRQPCYQLKGFVGSHHVVAILRVFCLLGYALEFVHSGGSLGSFQCVGWGSMSSPQHGKYARPSVSMQPPPTSIHSGDQSSRFTPRGAFAISSRQSLIAH